MALTYTPPGELAFPCPDFTLSSVDGRTYTKADFAHYQALVVMFLCSHCPYVRAIEDRLLRLAHAFRNRDVGFVAIGSNDPSEHPEDSATELLKRWRDKNYSFPYLLDGDQSVARAFAAVCTPDLYIFDASHKLRYRGRLDDSWRNPDLVRREELKEALEQILTGRPVNELQNPSMGCSIKWKKG